MATEPREAGTHCGAKVTPEPAWLWVPASEESMALCVCYGACIPEMPGTPWKAYNRPTRASRSAPVLGVGP